MSEAPESLPPADDAATPLVPHVEAKAVSLLALTVLLVVGFFLYVMYARGVFDHMQQLVLVADDSEGVVVGSHMSFSGFPLGRVRAIELAADGKARILIDVPVKDARWLRSSTVFTLERGVVGEARIRAFSNVLTDPALPDGAERPVLRGDTSGQLQQLLITVRSLVENLERMSSGDSGLNASIANLHELSERMKGRYGLLGAAVGSEENAKKVLATVDRTQQLVDRGTQLLDRSNALLGKTDQRVFGSGGAMDETQKALQQLNAILGDARESLKKADAVLVEAQGVGANARLATADLAALRAEVDATLRKVGHLVDEVNRKWPLARDAEIRLP